MMVTWDAATDRAHVIGATLDRSRREILNRDDLFSFAVVEINHGRSNRNDFRDMGGEQQIARGTAEEYGFQRGMGGAARFLIHIENDPPGLSLFVVIVEAGHGNPSAGQIGGTRVPF